jgi:hypothetical protein
LFLTPLTRAQEKGTDLRICSRFRRIRFEMDMSSVHQTAAKGDIHPP